MINYYFNDAYKDSNNEEGKLKPYTFQAEANEGTLPPDNATRIEPEKEEKGFVACWSDESWYKVEDNRDKTAYSIETKEPITIDYLGEIKEGFTLLEPFEFCKWNDGEWELDEVAKKQASIPKSLSRAQALTVMDLTPISDTQSLLDVIQEYMQSIDTSVPMYKYIKYVWENSIEFNRNDDVITTIAAIFKISDEQLDDMFITGHQFSTSLGG